MLNEKRVKHMVKLASYESRNGTEEIKISSYFRKDYVSYNVLISLVWTTLGYISLVAILCLSYMQKIVEDLSFSSIVTVVIVIVVGYILSLIMYGVIAARHYKKKHLTAKNNVKKYLHNLDILEKMYEREEA